MSTHLDSKDFIRVEIDRVARLISRSGENESAGWITYLLEAVDSEFAGRQSLDFGQVAWQVVESLLTRLRIGRW